MSFPDEPSAIRWEAWSHRQIYEATHTAAVGPGHPLATTVVWWRETVADLGEVRTRYQAAVDRLNEASGGASADAANASSQLVTRGLTEARELAGLAGAKRARLYELNEHLRREMPEPRVPVEDQSPFLDRGLGWLTPPEFHRAEADRLNAEERARDLMRSYEKGIAPEALTANAHNSTDNPAHSDHSDDGPTVPLSDRLTGGAMDAESAHPPDESAEPPADDDGSWRFGMVSRRPMPHWLYGEFGPEGHVDLNDDADTDSSDEQSRAAGGPIPALRDEGDNPASPSRIADSLFEPDLKACPPVIGE